MLQRVTDEELRETFRDERGAHVLGGRRGGRLRARALARVDPRARRPDRLGRGAHRAGPRAAGHGQRASGSSRRSWATSTATCDFGGRADHAGATPMGFRVDAAIPAAETIVELERLARELGGGVVGTVGEIAVEPGADQRRPRRRAPLARHCARSRAATASSASASSRSRASAARRAASGGEWAPRQELRAADGRAASSPRSRRARGRAARRSADAVGRGPRHAGRGLARAERDGLRPLRRRALATRRSSRPTPPTRHSRRRSSYCAIRVAPALIRRRRAGATSAAASAAGSRRRARRTCTSARPRAC